MFNNNPQQENAFGKPSTIIYVYSPELWSDVAL